MKVLLQVLWFLLPLAAANTTPVLARHLFPSWNWPVDGGLEFRGKRVFGSHKTVRGLVCGILAAALVYWMQRRAEAGSSFLRELSVLDGERHGAWLGALLGAGALAGDLVKSFAKRRVGVAPGKPWIPFDQVDWIVGGLLVAAPFATFGAAFVATALLVAPASSLLAHWVGYLVRLNEEPV